MDLENKTLKQLQKMCKTANMKVSGNKNDLIKRLKENEQQNGEKEKLLSRIRELENTVNQLQVQCGQEQNGNETDLHASTFRSTISSPPRMVTFANTTVTPHVQNMSLANTEVSSQVQNMSITNTELSPQVQVMSPIVSNSLQMSDSLSNFSSLAQPKQVQAASLPSYTQARTVPPYIQTATISQCTQSASVPHYAQSASVPHYAQSASGPQYIQIAVPQITSRTQYTYGNDTQNTHVSIPHTNSMFNGMQNVYGCGSRRGYASDIPYCAQPTAMHQSSFYPMSVPVGVQNGYVSATNVTPSVMSGMTHAMDAKTIITLLPDFDPTDERSPSSKQFVQRIQMLKNAYNWSDDHLLIAVQQKLRGHAKYWVDSLNEVFLNWQHFARKLTETFPFNENETDAHMKLASTKRNIYESPQEYYFKMLSLGSKHGLTERAIARHIINGINDDDLKKKISNDYMLCGDLLQDIENYCRFNDIKVTTNHKFNNKNFQNFQNTQRRGADKQGPEQPNPDKNQPRQIDKRSKCYNCNRYGHISSGCPQPQRLPRCLSCNKYHNPSVQCKSTSTVRKMAETTQTKPELIKQVHINDWSGQAIVDSGSDRTLIRQSVISKLGPTEKCHVTLNGFGGSQVVATMSKVVTIVIDGIAHEVNALAVNNENLDADILLGRDVLCQQNTRVIIEDKKCWVEAINEVATDVSKLEHNALEKLKTVLTENRDCFAQCVTELGTCKIKQMEIKLTTNVPINVKPYSIAFAKRPEVRKILNELLETNIIEQSDSPYASPVVLVPKRDGNLRMCVDYRQLNRITIRTPFPMPVIEEQLAQLAGNRYFTSMDLKMGYHQVEMHKESRKYTAFVTLNGHYQYTRMPFGLVNAPAVFQEIMNILAAKMEPGEILTYLDDVVIPSKTADEGIRRLSKFFNILREAGLTLKLDKCKFLAEEINFLGHVINTDGVSPGTEKISAIQNFKVPMNLTEVRRFLGLTGFFRKFIPNYALITKPLTMLLRKTEAGKFIWNDAQEFSFRKLIALLCEKPVLALYDFTATHEVHTDASKVGLAGVLLQTHDGGKWQAVYYYSRCCTSAESRYHAYELEVLAAVETLTRFRVYLLGKKFNLVTDCSALAKIKEQKELIAKIARWYLRLMEFDFVPIHRPGTQLAHVDALSRSPNEMPCETETAGFIHHIMIEQNDWLFTMQLQDERLKHIILVLQGKVEDDQKLQYQKAYQLKKFRLYKNDGGLKYVVPKAVRWRIVKSCHDDVGHFGVEKTLARIRQNFWFARMRNYVKSYIAACVECCYAKMQGGRKEGQLYVADVNPLPFATLHLDHLGPFIKSARGMSYVLAIMDAFSKFLIVKPVRTTKTGPVISTLLDITTYFGLPSKIITDRGTAYTSKEFERFCDTNAIQHIKNAVRTPRANGQVERANQSILASLRTLTEKPKDWDLQLRTIQWAINSQKNATTGFSPNELVFDFSLRDLMHNKMIAALQEEDVTTDSIPDIKEKRQLAAEHILKEREKWKQRFDSRHATPTVYKPDDMVLLENVQPATGESRKLEPKYKGPYLIAKALGNDRYVVTDVPGMQLTQKPFESVYTADKLKRWCNTAPELDGDSLADSDEDQSPEDDTPSGRAEMSADQI